MNIQFKLEGRSRKQLAAAVSEIIIEVIHRHCVSGVNN